jgi:hypothetical protein
VVNSAAGLNAPALPPFTTDRLLADAVDDEEPDENVFRSVVTVLLMLLLWLLLPKPLAYVGLVILLLLLLLPTPGAGSARRTCEPLEKLLLLLKLPP